MIGLTGTLEQCAHAARQFRVYYSRAITDGSDDKSDDEEDYLIDHSIIMYLIAPDGEFVKFFGKNETVDSLTKQTADIIRRWNADHQHRQ